MKSAKADEIGSPLGQTDPVEKSSADDREVYKRTPREETAIENENIMSWKKTVGFQPQYLTKYVKSKGRGTDLTILLPFFVFGYPGRRDARHRE